MKILLIRCVVNACGSFLGVLIAWFLIENISDSVQESIRKLVVKFTDVVEVLNKRIDSLENKIKKLQDK